jgi:hypothetical protein
MFFDLHASKEELLPLQSDEKNYFASGFGFWVFASTCADL